MYKRGEILFRTEWDVFFRAILLLKHEHEKYWFRNKCSQLNSVKKISGILDPQFAIICIISGFLNFSNRCNFELTNLQMKRFLEFFFAHSTLSYLFQN